MSRPEPSRPAPRGGVKPLQRRIAVPSWLISAVLHFLVLMLAVGLPLWSTPRQGGAVLRTADVGIVLRHQEDDDRYYEGPDNATAADLATAATNDTAGLDQLLSDQPATDASQPLPTSLPVIGPGALDGGAVGTAMGADTGPRGGGGSSAGKGRTSVFGIQGEGYKFAYVFDRSGSMESALRVAKEQLVASLESLDDTHQFQLIFYNDRVLRFSPTGEPNRLFFATPRNKNLAAKFIDSIVASAGTNHEQALMLAIKLQPDVIFFMTDANEPKLYPGQLDKIKRRAAGITIHAIEFGFGPPSDRNNFLVRLARDNGGKHGYVDISHRRFVPRK